MIDREEYILNNSKTIKLDINKKINNMKITKLRILLEEKGMTQKEVCETLDRTFETGISREMLSLIVQGKRTNVHTDTIMKLCQVLDCTPNDIMEREEFLKRYPSSQSEARKNK